MNPGDKVFLNNAPTFTWTIASIDGDYLTLNGLEGKHNKSDYTLEAPVPEVSAVIPPNDRTEIYNLPSLNPQVPSYEEIVELDTRIAALESSQHPSNKNLMIAIIGSILLHAILLVI